MVSINCFPHPGRGFGKNFNGVKRKLCSQTCFRHHSLVLLLFLLFAYSLFISMSFYLASYCCVTSHLKTQWLKIIFIISQLSQGTNVRTVQLGPSSESVPGCDQRVDQGYSHLRVQLEKNLLPSLPMWSLAGFSFLQDIKLRALVSCWLLAGGHP